MVCNLLNEIISNFYNFLLCIIRDIKDWINQLRMKANVASNLKRRKYESNKLKKYLIIKLIKTAYQCT